MTDRYYQLIGKLPVPCPDLTAWALAFETTPRPVGQDQIGPLMVSTVFLGINHRLVGDGAPLLFETMVFGGAEADEMEEVYCRRYSTWDDAEAGHAEAIAWAKERLAAADAALRQSR